AACNTRRSYEPKQGEWVRWCDGCQFVDRSVVTEDKILLFLEGVTSSAPKRLSVLGPTRIRGARHFLSTSASISANEQHVGANNSMTVAKVPCRTRTRSASYAMSQHTSWS
ncbi:hypothetical protein GN958_ATG22730, partial [Phytophthora infestans]